MRRLFYSFSLLSGLLCVLVTLAWIRSEFAFDTYWGRSLNPQTRHYGSPVMATDRGHLMLVIRTGFDASGNARGVPWHRQTYQQDLSGSLHNAAWFSFTITHDPKGPDRQSQYRLECRIGLIALPLFCFTAPPLFMLLKLVRRRRNGAGLCRNCGYDLRATPDRCPECGLVA